MIYLVTGHPRSGTSMLMQACEAGGLPVAKSKERDAFNRANSSRLWCEQRGVWLEYKPNPNGLYELAGIELSKTDWPTKYDGHAVKVVTDNLGALRPHGPWWCRWWPTWAFPQWRRRALLASGKCYSAVIMLRDQEEIRQSFQASFGVDRTVERIVQWQMWAEEILGRRPDVADIKTLWFTEVIADPVASFTSLGWPINVGKAAAVVDPVLYRVRVGSLVEGI